MTSNKGKPSVSIGHVTMRTRCMSDSIRFMQAIGMQVVFEGSQVSILELRGGTHLLLLPSDEPAEAAASFDLMVDDLQAMHRKLSGLGYVLTPIVPRPEVGHETFEVTEPTGTRIVCYSSHATCT